jgi:hypothetical protein
LRTFTVTTEPGTGITADIWFRCYGVRPVSDYLVGDLADARQPDGFVEVTPYLQVAGQDASLRRDMAADQRWRNRRAAGRTGSR